MSVVGTLIDQIRNSVFIEGDLRKQIEELKKKRRIMEERLYKVCEHQFERDYSAPFDDVCKNVCTICGLYDNPYLYNANY